MVKGFLFYLVLCGWDKLINWRLVEICIWDWGFWFVLLVWMEISYLELVLYEYKNIFIYIKLFIGIVEYNIVGFIIFY